ncbi:MAG: helix-turn-helix domain-containing protein, partial [Gemmataceae bacterium]
CLQRAVILGDGPWITPADLPADLLAPVPESTVGIENLNAALQAFEAQHLERILQKYDDKREAARVLGIGVSSLYRKIEQHHLGSIRQETP